MTLAELDGIAAAAMALQHCLPYVFLGFTLYAVSSGCFKVGMRGRVLLLRVPCSRNSVFSDGYGDWLRLARMLLKERQVQ